MIEPTVEQSIQYFSAQAVQHARSLPVPKARMFLKGLLCSSADPDAGTSVIRDIYEQLLTVERLMEKQQPSLFLTTAPEGNS